MPRLDVVHRIVRSAGLSLLAQERQENLPGRDLPRLASPRDGGPAGTGPVWDWGLAAR